LRRLQGAPIVTEGAGEVASIQVSEMLPAAPDMWMADGADQRYTSELRLVAVDLRGPVPGQGRPAT
jgi:hypothetical protein